MTPIRSVTEISCAIQDADDSQSFQFTYKEELLGYMLDFMKEEPIDSLASPVRLRAMLAIGHLRAGTKRHLQGSGQRLLSLQLGKVKPSLNLDENRNILDDCLKCLLPLPAVQQLREEGEMAQDSFQIQLLEPWFFSDKEWERDRVLQVSSQLLVTYRETVYCRLQEPFEQFGSLLGLLVPYTCTTLATSHLWAAECIACFLHLQDQGTLSQSMTMDAVEEKLRGLHEELKA
ncbi:hypothetical protein Y1Q_0019453 [Alligator mississippiensis]|uniref:Maestro heat-like repeat-containing protein family member 7 n=1 Tax=Alligator mississippiensis TaxID=8496 RepID=A0A151NMB6_ALLMI|nr:hypothetical protein Y1Q_0019453 [Alligator mississippiensis]